MDSQVVSTTGLSEEDLAKIKKADFVEDAAGEFSKDVIVDEEGHTLKLNVYKKDQTINQYSVVSGRLPEKSGEIALDENDTTKTLYKIGDKISLEGQNSSEDLTDFKTTSFTVVGFVHSPLYIENFNRGTTTIGKGSLDGFGVLYEQDYTPAAYSSIYVTYKDLQSIDSYDAKYSDRLEKDQKKLKKLLADLPQEKLDTLKASGQAEIDKAKNEISQGEQELASARQQLAAAQAALGSRQALTGDSMSQKSLADSQTQIAAKEEELTAAKTQLAQKESELAAVPLPELYFSSREDDQAYTEYKQNAERIANIANVFPVFFFFIAALVTLTTMARMVDEQRQQVGTLKALGYTNGEVSLKFLFYSASAGVIGSLLGLAFGNFLFPTVIYYAYGILYNLPELITQWYWQYTLISFVVALLCTAVTAWLVLRIEVREVPAVLMQQRAPKAGNRIFLERLTFIWRRLNFFEKVTARNLFRYKQRMLMTVFGIAGCMALLITGFGLKDSISDIVTLQFNKLWHYDTIVTFQADGSQSDRDQYQKILDDTKGYDESLKIAIEEFQVSKKNETTQDVSIYVPKKTENLSDFVLLNDRSSGKKYSLTDDGAVINEKLANLFGLHVGDSMELKQEDGQIYKIKIAAVAENYAGHFAYLSPKYYEKVFDKQPEYNSELLKLDLSKKAITAFSEKLMKVPAVLNVHQVSESAKSINESMSSLNIIVWVLIISASALAFIVLYNLTNINVSERIRELSTIKVLGFYDREVTSYIYRENNILTFLGILAGCFFGRFLHAFVMQAAEMDAIMFVPGLQFRSYLLGALLTLVFAVLVMIIMHFKLKKIDMIEALKSND